MRNKIVVEGPTKIKDQNRVFYAVYLWVEVKDDTWDIANSYFVDEFENRVKQ